MPVTLKKLKGGTVQVSTPNGIKSKGTTPEKAAHQRNLLNAVEHSDWRPTGQKKARPMKIKTPNREGTYS